MNSNFYTQEEIDFLIEHYTKFGSKFCSEKLNRDIKSIQYKVRNLGLKYNFTKFIYTKEFLEPVIKESKNFADAFKKLKLTQTGASMRVMQKHIIKNNIDITHFEQHKLERLSKFSGIGRAKSIPLVDILIENSTYTTTSHLKQRLYNEGLKQRCCELCGQGEEWKGVKISLILDHINGISNDNRLENLQIVCPNCNAGLETHCRGHKGLKKEEIKETNINKQVNLKEKALKARKVERPPYEELKRLIEMFGYNEIGRRYGVSDNSIRKWLKNYEKHGY